MINCSSYEYDKCPYNCFKCTTFAGFYERCSSYKLHDWSCKPIELEDITLYYTLFFVICMVLCMIACVVSVINWLSYHIKVNFRVNIVRATKDLEECSICLCLIEENQYYSLLPCKHSTFHSECLEGWTLGTCPLCRQPYEIRN